MDKQLIAKIDQYLVSPDHNIKLFTDHNIVMRQLLQEQKRLIFFIFENPKCLLSWLRDKSQQKVEVIGLTWKQSEDGRINIGKHERVLLEAKSIPNGIVLVILAGEYCCSATSLRIK